MAIRIVTDSTSDIPEELRSELRIEMVPLKVLFGSDTYRDSVDMTTEQFYRKLAESSTLPTTSQPSPIEFLEVYKRLTQETKDCEIISIHLSSALSGTYQSAQLAKSMYEEDGGTGITVVDSKSASYGIGILVVAAARAALDGQSKEQILQLIKRMREGSRLYFLVDTLEYLQKGGRIGKASALIGSLLNIKPILSINDEGEVYSVDKVRGHKKAVARIAELLEDELGGSPVHMVTAHGSAPQYAEDMQVYMQNCLNTRSSSITHIGPVIGTHVGPGVVAVFTARESHD
jgi:DegV family protein with EDD domain